MKVYRKIMQIITKIEDIVLAISVFGVMALTFGNVIARKVFQHSWGFTEEIVVAVFVLISLLGAGVAAKQPGGLVNLGIISDNVGPKARKVLNTIANIICIAYSGLLAYEGYDRMVTDHTASPILHISKSVFWAFVLIGGISLILHFIENTIDFLQRDLVAEVEEQKKFDEEAKKEEAEEEKEEAEKIAEAKAERAEEKAEKAETKVVKAVKAVKAEEKAEEAEEAAAEAVVEAKENAGRKPSNNKKKSGKKGGRK